MASDVEMSLEEIINKKKKSPARKQQAQIRSNNGVFRSTTMGGKQPGVGIRPGDARNKLILKRRTQIGDLRDKLAVLSKQKDARFKLDKLRLRQAFGHRQERNIGFNKSNQQNKRIQRNFQLDIHRGFMDLSRQVRSGPLPAPPKFKIDRQIGYAKPKITSLRSDRFLTGHRIAPKPILRTVENDAYVTNTNNKPIVIDDDYDLPPVPRAAAFNLQIVAHNDTAWNKVTSLTTKSSERDRLPPSILKKRPMAALRMDRERRRTPPPASPPASPPAPAPEYRIIVSNLRTSVTGTDIQELFGDIGGLMESRLVRPGTAEVIYSSLEDAQRAVELYHNRQLDGQPMNCLLVNPRQSVASSGRLGGSMKVNTTPAGSSSVVPDIDTFHKPGGMDGHGRGVYPTMDA